MLSEELSGEMPSFPHANTIRTWRRNEGWDDRASQDIAQVAQMLNRRHFEKLFTLTEEALEVKASILANDHPEQDSKRLDVIARTATELLKLRGLGTAGVIAGGIEPPKPQASGVEAAANVQEASAMLRDEILQNKQIVAGKKKHR